MTYPPIIGGASLLIALPLQQKATLIIGGGHLATSRANAALQADSKVVMIVRKETDSDEEIVVRAKRREIELVQLDEVEADALERVLDTFGRISVAFVTDTLIGLEKRRSYESASGLCTVLKKRNILVNVADQPSLCDFTLPATHRFSCTITSINVTASSQEPSSLQIAITTNGKGCRLAGRIRREIVTRLPSNIGDAVENVSLLRERAKALSALPAVEENEDSLPSTPNDPVPQRRLRHTVDVGEGEIGEETPEEAQKRRMKWVAQISEFWPLEKLAALDSQGREDILQDAIRSVPSVQLNSGEQELPGAIGMPVHPEVPSRHSLELVPVSPPKGSIYLLGSGPGHPGLLTVAAHSILTTKATLVLSDKLVPAEVLALIPPNITVKIAKKFPGNADGAQNEMMLEAVKAAGRGQTVVRLKQGDPMVYGRAGEEVLYFRQHGYEAIVIPGLSSAIAGPTFAGIPVTQRGVAESLVLCTGVGRGGKGTLLPGYQRERTLVLLMGVARLEELVETLISTSDGETTKEKGRRDGAPYPRNLPIAIIERASMPDQRVISGTLESISAAMKSAEVGEQRPPGMIVVGWSVLALTGSGDVSVLDDAVNADQEALEVVDRERVRRWLGDAGWSVKEGFTRWD